MEEIFVSCANLHNELHWTHLLPVCCVGREVTHMALLEDLAPGMILKGIRPQTAVTIVAVTRHGADSAEIVYKDAAGGLGTQLLYRDDTEQLEVAPTTLPWSFTANGSAFRLVSEAYRIRLAYLFDPLIAVHTSLIGVWQGFLPETAI